MNLAPGFVLALAAAQAPEAGKGPPGTVYVPGGRTAIGTAAADIEQMVERDPDAREYAGALSAETPQRLLQVADFWLMATEVTNEQYAAFVKAAGVRPPETWGQRRIDAACRLYLSALERERGEARAQLKADPASSPFDRGAWWRLHWNDSSEDLPAFEIPGGEERLPVVFVDWNDARSYARWAGLRLPSEVEYQRAVRGDEARTYPWGNEWEDGKYAETSRKELRSGASPVGSYPLGASRQGAFDLAGNVWEWTSSPYLPFPGYQRRVFAVGYGTERHPVNAIADFDAGQRIVVGGSFQNGRLMARATTRRAADRTQATDALGFRCAASTHAGLDAADAILESELTPNVRARDARGMVEFAPEATVCVEGWATAKAAEGSPPGYAVIAGYQRVLFVPVRVIPANDPGGLERLGAAEGLVALGFLSTSLASLAPDLPPGTYQVFWRPKGGRSAASAGGAGSEEAPLEEVLKIDPSLDHLVLLDAHGHPAHAQPCRLAWENMRESRAVWMEAAESPQTGGEAAPAGSRMIHFDLCVPSRSGQKGFRFELRLRLAPDALSVSWRPR
jgi:formylglycine-generating enzyme required for sulfatase activity